MTHRNGILFYETTVFSEIDCNNFIQNMEIKFDELATKHSNELSSVITNYQSAVEIIYWSRQLTAMRSTCINIIVIIYQKMYLKVETTKSGLFWNSDIHSHDQFLNNIKLPLYL